VAKAAAPQTQRLARPVNLSPFCRPPTHQVVDRFEIAVDRVAASIVLAVVPGVVDPLQVSFESFLGVRQGQGINSEVPTAGEPDF
jgi:hypothetical protein